MQVIEPVSYGSDKNKQEAFVLEGESIICSFRVDECLVVWPESV